MPKPADKSAHSKSWTGPAHRGGGWQLLPAVDAAPLHVVVAGNPNSGKTTLFNALTGLRQKVANYPGVTVEKKSGSLTHQGRRIELIDLPGTYSLNATSEDEQIVTDHLLGLAREDARPAAVVIALDATHLERGLFLVSQLQELGLPLIIALTMDDEARKSGLLIEPARLSQELQLPVVEVHAARGLGLSRLRDQLVELPSSTGAPAQWQPPAELARAIEELAASIMADRELRLSRLPLETRRTLAWQALLGQPGAESAIALIGPDRLEALRAGLDAQLPAWREAEAVWRHAQIAALLARVRQPLSGRGSLQSRADRLLTHPLAGLLVFAVVMALVFQSIFSWAVPAMDLIDSFFGWLGGAVAALLPAGPLQGLIVDGIIGGVGGVLIFLPQIMLLFLMIALLEDSGYMARAAAMMHRHMRKAGLHGRSFIPMLGGFACAIPAIMATRSIPDRRDRLVTMLAIPFMSCSARLPVYALVIGAFVPALQLLPGFTLQGLVLWSAYFVSVVAAILTALLLRRTALRGANAPFIIELPPYRWPSLRTVLLTMLERAKLFVTQAGTVILAISILLWLLANFPVDRQTQQAYQSQLASLDSQQLPAEQLAAERDRLSLEASSSQLRYSLAGRLGHLLEPAIEPLGFDWKIGVGLIASFAAREVLVSTLAIVYGVEETGESGLSLQEVLKQERDPESGLPVYTPLAALNLMLFFILACQCMSTVAVVKRETGGWKWPTFMVVYMTSVAYLACLAFYQLGRLWFPGLAGVA